MRGNYTKKVACTMGSEQSTPQLPESEDSSGPRTQKTHIGNYMKHQVEEWISTREGPEIGGVVLPDSEDDKSCGCSENEKDSDRTKSSSPKAFFGSDVEEWTRIMHDS